MKSNFVKAHGIHWLRGKYAGMQIIFPPEQTFSIVIGSPDMIDFGVKMIVNGISGYSYYFISYDQDTNKYMLIDDFDGSFRFVENDYILTFEDEAIGFL